MAQPLSHQVPLPAPTSVTLSCDPDAGELTIGVAAVVSATHYQIDLLDHAHADAVILTAVRPTPASGPLTVTVDTRLLPGGVAAGATLTARAFALGDIVHSDSPVTFSDPAAALATLGPAGMPLLRLTASRLQVDWEPLAGATGGEVRVTDAAGVPLSPPPPVTIEAAGSAGVNVTAIPHNDGIAVRPLRGDAVGLWSPVAASTLTRLASPSAAAVVFMADDAAITLSWTPDPRAAGTDIEITDGEGRTLAPAPQCSAAADGAKISGPAVTTGATYKLRGRSTAPGFLSSLWTSWTTITTESPPAPARVSLRWAAGGFEATWDAVADASYPAVLAQVAAHRSRRWW